MDRLAILLCLLLLTAAACARPEIETSQPMPAPFPDNAPIAGDRVSLEEARARTPYEIPLPGDTHEQADLLEVWVSPEGVPPEHRQVYLIYSNGIRVSIGGRPDKVDYSTHATPPFRAASVNGIPASGKNPTSSERGSKAPASLSWWVNGVQIALYHPELTMNQLLSIAESMPVPEWTSREPVPAEAVSSRDSLNLPPTPLPPLLPAPAPTVAPLVQSQMR